jgi:acyl-CoA reductase-like NAD-dependent aldehyde dehydrogenase
MADANIAAILDRQRAFYDSGQTRPVEFRLRQLRALEQAMRGNERAILAALQADLRKSDVEGFATEVGVALEDLKHIRRRLRGWARPRRVPVHWVQLPGSAWIYPEPYGTALIIGPWNFPFLLIVAPLIGAIAAGNCAVLKPSEVAPNTSHLLARLIADTFDPGYVTVVEGDAQTAQALLAHRFDYIFYTGGATVGKLILQAAAQHLTPATLELGGKSPAVIDADVDLKTAAQRVVWGKFTNAGQICITPDYALVDRRVKTNFIALARAAIREFFGDDPQRSPDYGRIINACHFDRLRALLAHGNIVHGGQTDATDRYIAPTLIDTPVLDSPLMQEEIFGPLLPIVAYDSFDDAIRFLNARPKPLALYFFSRSAANQERILRETSSGGVCINDVMLHYANSALPFGGVGASGMGKYHGRYSFDTFTHPKAVLKKPFWLDIRQRYMPYSDTLLRLLRRLV